MGRSKKLCKVLGELDSLLRGNGRELAPDWISGSLDVYQPLEAAMDAHPEVTKSYSAKEIVDDQIRIKGYARIAQSEDITLSLVPVSRVGKAAYFVKLFWGESADERIQKVQENVRAWLVKTGYADNVSEMTRVTIRQEEIMRK